VREHDRATKRWATRFSLWVVFFFKVGRKQRKDKRGFVPFLFLHGSSYEGAHHQKHEYQRLTGKPQTVLEYRQTEFVALCTSGKF